MSFSVPTATAIGNNLNMAFKVRHRHMLKDILKPPDEVRVSGLNGGQSSGFMRIYLGG